MIMNDRYYIGEQKEIPINCSKQVRAALGYNTSALPHLLILVSHILHISFYDLFSYSELALEATTGDGNLRRKPT